MFSCDSASAVDKLALIADDELDEEEDTFVE
ncbi:hypothetical protein LAA29_100232 [Leuconostoc carnosum]|nr:hypothetical protein LCAC16_90260 [Leuconostoc carnosum]SPO33083.1 hypothetical protein LAA29_100232 [Leuconostoc carnosum]